VGAQEEVQEKAKTAKEASRILARLSTEERNRALLAMADLLEKERQYIKEANEKDMKYGREKGLSSALMDRLLLDDKRINSMAQGLREVAALPDPLGEVPPLEDVLPTDALPLTLWKYAQQPYPERVHQAWAVALVLMVFVLLLNIAARVWLARTRKGG
jgi:hypothetical protein